MENSCKRGDLGAARADHSAYGQRARRCANPDGEHHPASRGKGHGFWHCVSEGGLEDERTPDLDRCRRIGWIRAIIENATRADVQHWTNQRGGETRHLLWFREEYLVVLAERQGYYLLKSAYPTNREHTRGKLRRERDQAKNG